MNKYIVLKLDTLNVLCFLIGNKNVNSHDGTQIK